MNRPRLALLCALLMGSGLGFAVSRIAAPARYRVYSDKDGASLLLDVRTGETWFVSNGYWKKLPREK